MKEVGYITALFMLGTFLVTWVLGRIAERLREALGIIGGVVVRVGVGVILTLTAAEAAIHGGFWWLLVPVLVLPALWNLLLAAGIVWAWTTEEPDAPAG